MKKLLVTILVLFGVVFLAGCNQQPITQTQTLVQTGNFYDNWQTYRNTKYGFEIKYPSDHVVNVVNAISGAVDNNGTRVVFFKNGEKIGSAPYLVIEYNDNKREEYLSDPSIELIESTPINIEGVDGTKDKFSVIGNESMSWLTVYLNKDGINYSIISNEDLDNFNQLLETFKFIE